MELEHIACRPIKKHHQGLLIIHFNINAVKQKSNKTFLKSLAVLK